jgi:hypothetical protein
MKLPNAEYAVVDIEKLRGYCLNKTHPRGRHKARVFESALGLRTEDAEILRVALLDAVMTHEAIPIGADRYGNRYMIDFSLSGPSGTAMIRSRWIVVVGENIARLTTCYVL